MTPLCPTCKKPVAEHRRMLFEAAEEVRRLLREHRAVSERLMEATYRRDHAQYPTLYSVPGGLDGLMLMTACLCGRRFRHRETAEKHADGCDGQEKRRRKRSKSAGEVAPS